MHQEHVTRDRERPRRDRTARLVGAPRPVQLHERFLHEIIGDDGVAAMGHQIAAQPRRERRVKRVEGGNFAVEVRGHEPTQLEFRGIGGSRSFLHEDFAWSGGGVTAGYLLLNERPNCDPDML